MENDNIAADYKNKTHLRDDMYLKTTHETLLLNDRHFRWEPSKVPENSIQTLKNIKDIIQNKLGYFPSNNQDPYRDFTRDQLWEKLKDQAKKINLDYQKTKGLWSYINGNDETIQTLCEQIEKLTAANGIEPEISFIEVPNYQKDELLLKSIRLSDFTKVQLYLSQGANPNYIYLRSPILFYSLQKSDLKCVNF